VPESGKAKTLALTNRPPSDASPTIAAPAKSWAEQERLIKQRVAQEAVEKAARSEANARPPRALSNGMADGTDASRCKACGRRPQRLTSSSERRAPIDHHDIDTAESDVRHSCH
jgi:hypothetical protein